MGKPGSHHLSPETGGLLPPVFGEQNQNRTMTPFLPVATGCLILGLFAPLVLAADSAKLPPASDRQGVAYATDIKPLLDRSCIKCHGPEKAKHGLRLDSLAGALKGGTDGKVIKPGHSADSPLVRAVARVAKEPMPPEGKGPPLTPAEVGLIRAWIDQGAH